MNMPSADMIQSLNLMPHYEGISSDDEQYELDITELKKQQGYYFRKKSVLGKLFRWCCFFRANFVGC